MALTTTIGGSTSDSYGDLAAFNAYATSIGVTLTGADAVKEGQLRRATQYLDRTFNWRGYKASATQALDWPRSYAGYDSDGYNIASDTIPAKVITAQFELAIAINAGGDLFASGQSGAVVREKVKAGPVESETEYVGAMSRASYPAIYGLLEDYILGGSGMTNVVRG